MTYGDFVRAFHPDDRGLLPTIRALRSQACPSSTWSCGLGPSAGTVNWVHLKGRAVRRRRRLRRAPGGDDG